MVTEIRKKGCASARNESFAAALSTHCNVNFIGDSHMDKNRIDGAAKEIKGGVKEAFGKVTGNTGKQVAGAIEKNVGTAPTQDRRSR